MRIPLLSIVLLLVLANASCLLAQVALTYGPGPNQVSFINAKSDPNAEELFPIGPKSFRCAADGFWLVDSLAFRLLRLAPSGEVLTTFAVASGPAGFLEDLAVVSAADGQVSALYLIDGNTQQVIELAADGTLQRTFAGHGDAPGHFLQAELIEVNAAGQIFVADRARQTLTIFTSDAQVLRELHWEWSGFCLDPSGNLCRLRWDEEAGVNHLLIETADGQPVRDTILAVGAHTDPRLWRVTAAGEALVSWVPATGFAGAFKIASFDSAGQPVAVGEIVPPASMNRFLDQNAAGELIHVCADLESAPDGVFQLQPLALRR